MKEKIINKLLKINEQLACLAILNIRQINQLLSTIKNKISIFCFDKTLLLKKDFTIFEEIFAEPLIRNGSFY